MATHCSILAWRIPWMEEPGGLQSTGSQRVGHVCSSEVISTILSSSSLIHSSASDILLLIPSGVFLISVIVFSLHVYSLRSLLIDSCIFSVSVSVSLSKISFIPLVLRQTWKLLGPSNNLLPELYSKYFHHY